MCLDFLLQMEAMEAVYSSLHYQLARNAPHFDPPLGIKTFGLTSSGNSLLLQGLYLLRYNRKIHFQTSFLCFPQSPY